MADTTLTLRLTKGSQLTAQELDDNFTALDSSIDSAAGSLLPNNNTWTGTNAFTAGLQSPGAGTNSTRIGTLAGATSQGDSAVAVGSEAAKTSQGTLSVAIGRRAGFDTQGESAVAIGKLAGRDDQGDHCVSIGSQAGLVDQGQQSLAIGNGTGKTRQGQKSLALGTKAGQTDQGDNGIIISSTGSTLNDTTDGHIHIASDVASLDYTTASGWNFTGGDLTTPNTTIVNTNLVSDIPLKVRAKVGQTGVLQTWQDSNGVDKAYVNSLGAIFGSTIIGTTFIVFGGAGVTGRLNVTGGSTLSSTGAGTNSTSIGLDAGLTSQGATAVAIGHEAGKTSQGAQSIGIGGDAGSTSQGTKSISIGYLTGQTRQGTNAVAMGYNCGRVDQSNYAVAIGNSAGNSDQGLNTVAVGAGSAGSDQGNYAVAVGNTAGANTQGDYSIAIGDGAGSTSQGANGIIINSTGTTLNDTTAGHIHIASDDASLDYDNTLKWNFAGGNVGVNCTSAPLAALSAQGDVWCGNVQIATSSTQAISGWNIGLDGQLKGKQLDADKTNGTIELNCPDYTSGSDQKIRFRTGGSIVGQITSTGTGTTYNVTSDYRLKNITGPLTNSGAYIDSLNPVEGTWKLDGSVFVGLIAHETKAASRTDVVQGEKDGEEMQTMSYSSSEMIANLVKEVQMLRSRMAVLETK